MALPEVGLQAVIEGLPAYEAAARKVNQSMIDIGEGADHAAAKVTGMGGKVTGALGRVAEVAGGILTANVFSRIAEGVGSFTGSFLTANADMQKFETTLTTVYRSVAGTEEKAKAMAQETLQWAKTFANTTPFETPEVIEATVRLKSYGLEAKDVLKDTGDMAAGMGKPLMQAVEAIADAQTGELERLKEFGITKGMLVEQAAKMGKGELVNAKGQITDMATMNEALFALIEERFGGGMERMSKGWAGITSNISAVFGELALTIGGPIFDRISGALAGLLQILTDNQPAITAFGQAMGNVLGGAFDLVSQAISAAWPVLQSIFDWVQRFFGYFQAGNEFDFMGAMFGPELGPRIDEVVRAVKNLWAELGGFFDLVKAFLGGGEADFGAWLNDLLVETRTVIGDLVSSLQELLGQAFMMLGGFVQDQLTNLFGENIGLAFGGLYNAIWGVFSSIGEMITSFFDMLQGKVSFVDWISDAAGKIGGAVLDYWSALAGLLQAVIPQLIGQLAVWGQQLVDWIAPMIPPLLAEMAKLAERFLAWVGQQAPPLLAKLGDWAESFITWITPLIPPLLAEMARLADRFIAWIAEQAPPILARLGEWANAFVAWIVPMTVKFLQEWPGMLNRFLDWIGSAVPPIVAKLAEWAVALVQWVLPMIPPLLIALGGVAFAILAFIGETVLTIAAKLLEWAAEFIGWVAPMIPPLLVELGKLLLQLGVWIATTALPAIAGKLVEWGGAFLGWIAKDVLPTLGEKLGEILTALENWITNDALPGIVEKLMEWGNAFLNWVAKDVLPNLSEKLGQILTKLTGWIGEVAGTVTTAAGQIGRSLVDGIIAGINELWENLKTKIEELGGAIPGWMKSILGIASPSAVMAEIGADVVRGLIAGIEAQAGALEATVNGLGASIGEWFEGGQIFVGKAPLWLNVFLSRGIEGIVDAFHQFGKVTQQEMENWARGIGVPTWVAQHFVTEFGRLPKTLQEFLSFRSEHGWGSGNYGTPVAGTAPETGMLLVGLFEDMAGYANTMKNALGTAASFIESAMDRIVGGLDARVISRAASAFKTVMDELEDIIFVSYREADWQQMMSNFQRLVKNQAIVDSMEAIVLGFEELGQAIPRTMAEDMERLSYTLGEAGSAFRRFLELGEQRVALKALTDWMDEMEMAMNLSALVAQGLTLGLGIPTAVVNILDDLLETAVRNGPLAQVIASILEQVQAGEILTYHGGGVVPGPVGAPRLALLSGGETVMPATPGQIAAAGSVNNNALTYNLTANYATVQSPVTIMDDLQMLSMLSNAHA